MTFVKQIQRGEARADLSNAEIIKNEALKIASIVEFEYNGIYCNIDPFSESDFHIMCGNYECDVRSVDELMNTPAFLGKSLTEISDDIKVL